MKANSLMLIGIAAVVVTGCTSMPAKVGTPVGPDTSAAQMPAPQGNLQVFSAWEQGYPRFIDSSVLMEPYYDRVGYYIYGSDGTLVKRVTYNGGGEDLSAKPQMVSLPPGTYRVEALAPVGSGEWIKVPVVVEAGRTTEVHLCGHWAPPPNTPSDDVVYSPTGTPLGWRATDSP